MLGQSFDAQFEPPHRIERLQVNVRGDEFLWTVTVRSLGLDGDARKIIEQLCRDRVAEAIAERRSINPSDTSTSRTTVQWRREGTLEEKKSATGMSLTAFANVFRKLGEPSGSHLPAVVHAWNASPTLQTTLTPLIGDYPMDEVRRLVTRYNVLVEHVFDWQDAQKAVNGHAISEHLDKDRAEMIELWNTIVAHDKRLIATMKPHAANRKDLSPRALELYHNALERVSQYGSGAPASQGRASPLEPRKKTEAAMHAVSGPPVFSIMPVLAPRAETMATCACSLADLGESLRDKTIGE